MKNVRLIVFCIMCFSVGIFSCGDKSVKTPIDANVNIYFANKINAAPIVFNSLTYTNAAGNIYSVSLLKYYVSNVKLINSDGGEVAFHNFDLIDASDENTCVVSGTSIPNATYTALKFNIGVDSINNHTLNTNYADLDPGLGMVWAWATSTGAYTFFKHEGNCMQTGNPTPQQLTLHYGTDHAYATIQIPITLQVNGATKNMYIDFNLQNMYNSPVINFDTSNVQMSSSSLERQWIDDMKLNFGDAFSFDRTD